MGFEKKGMEYESEQRVGITPVKEEAEGLLQFGSSLLGMGTRYERPNKINSTSPPQAFG